MIDDIKEAVDNFQKDNEPVLTARDLMGINKIIFELDLLKVHEKKSKKKVLKAGEQD